MYNDLTGIPESNVPLGVKNIKEVDCIKEFNNDIKDRYIYIYQFESIELVQA